MSLTLGNPDALELALREAIIIATNTALKVGAGPNAILRFRGAGPTTLVSWPLAAQPLTVGASDGSAVVAPVNPVATATGGAATVATDYQLIDQAGTVRISGPLVGGDTITAGDLIVLLTTTITMPAA